VPDKQTLDFKSAGMKRAATRDAVAQKGKQFGISNFFGWAMQKYPKMTLGQLEARMPSLEREYGQEKTMRKAEPDMQPSVNSAFDDEKERKTAQGIATESELLRIKQLAGIDITEDKGYTFDTDGPDLVITSPEGKTKVIKDFTYFDEDPSQAELKSFFNRGKSLRDESINEDEEVTKDVVGHTDNEPDMIRKELFKMGKYSVELYKMIGELPNADFPHWWQAKIVKAGQYLSNAKHYLEGELNAPEPEALDNAEQEQDDINPSGV
jgi:hypothetical protein